MILKTELGKNKPKPKPSKMVETKMSADTQTKTDNFFLLLFLLFLSTFIWQTCLLVIGLIILDILNFFNNLSLTVLGRFEGNDQEVEFHEIEIHFFRRSNDFLIMRSNFFGTFHEVKIPNYLISWLQHFSWDQNSLIMLFRVSISWSFLRLTNQSWDQNSKKALLGNFDLMIDLLAASAIMRSKVFMHRWLKIRAKN